MRGRRLSDTGQRWRFLTCCVNLTAWLLAAPYPVHAVTLPSQLVGQQHSRPGPALCQPNTHPFKALSPSVCRLMADRRWVMRLDCLVNKKACFRSHLSNSSCMPGKVSGGQLGRNPCLMRAWISPAVGSSRAWKQNMVTMHAVAWPGDNFVAAAHDATRAAERANHPVTTCCPPHVALALQRLACPPPTRTAAPQMRTLQAWPQSCTHLMHHTRAA